MSDFTIFNYFDCSVISADDGDTVHLNVPVKFPDGWEANQAILAHLTR